MKKITVLYHAHCLDGYAAAWAAWKALGDHADYQAVFHQEPFPDFAEDSCFYIVDFCYPIDDLVRAAQRASQIVVIDHHLSAERNYKSYDGIIPKNVEFIFNMQHSGCLMTWHYFHEDKLPPLLLEHIEDNDLWRHDLEHTREITNALFMYLPLPFASFESLTIDKLYHEGCVLLKQQQKMVKTLLNSRHPIYLNGHQGLAVNAPAAFASDLGHALANISGTFGLTYHYHGKHRQYECGLRSVGDYNVSQLAVHFGGGGHKNAAGFRLNKKAFFACMSR